MNIVQYALKFGGVTDADVQGHIHAGLRSAPTSKTYQRWYQKRLRELQNARDETKRRYEASIASGEIAPPREMSRIERLREISKGHPDNAATQAAIRMLAKLGLDRDGEPF
jgi:hypothetical protein